MFFTMGGRRPVPRRSGLCRVIQTTLTMFSAACWALAGCGGGAAARARDAATTEAPAPSADASATAPDAPPPVVDAPPPSADAPPPPSADAPAPSPDAAGMDLAGPPAMDAPTADHPGPADGRGDGAPSDVATEGGAGDHGDGGDTGDSAAAVCGICSAYGAPVELGRVSNVALNALSGIAVSRKNPQVVFVHNDHQTPQFFALSEAGALLGTYNLTGATPQDLEDIAVGPCPGGSCVYLADIGGNLSSRTNYSIFRTTEPAVQTTQAGVVAAVPFERLAFSYPDGGVHNAESLLVDPALAALYIITKVSAGLPSTVYRLPATFGGAPVVAQKVVDLTVPAASDTPATSASAHPCLPGFLLRTNNTLYEFRAPAGGKLEDAFSAPPTVVPVAAEPQGEGVAYRPDGRGYVTTSEGTRPAINGVNCR